MIKHKSVAILQRYRSAIVAIFILMIVLVVFGFLMNITEERKGIADVGQKPKDLEGANLSGKNIPIGLNNVSSSASKITEGQKEDETLCKDVSNIIPSLYEKKQNLQADQLRIEEAESILEKKLLNATQLSSEIDRAAAYVMLSHLQAERTGNLLHDNCGANDSCHEKVSLAEDASASMQINEIAKLAVYSNNPELYSMAFHACHRLENAKKGYCGQIDATQWAQRDPTNGTVWLYVLNKIEQTQNEVPKDVINNAMYRLSQAKKFDLGLPYLAEFEQKNQLQLNSSIEKYLFMNLAFGAFSRAGSPSFGSVVNLCQSETIRDFTRRQLCDNIAQKIISHGNTAKGLYASEKLAVALGWEADRVSNIHKDLVAIKQLDRLSIEDQLNLKVVASTSVTDKVIARCVNHLKRKRIFEDRMRNGDLVNFKKQIIERKTTRDELVKDFMLEQAGKK